jgi:hypothetical protein
MALISAARPYATAAFRHQDFIGTKRDRLLWEPRAVWSEGSSMLGTGEMLRMLRGPARFAAIAALLLIVSGVGTAQAFDYASYQPGDLDALARRKPPLGLGADIPSVQSVRFEVTLAEQADECPTKYLKWAMRKSGIAKDAVASTPITRCIEVKSAKAGSIRCSSRTRSRAA